MYGIPPFFKALCLAAACASATYPATANAAANQFRLGVKNLVVDAGGSGPSEPSEPSAPQGSLSLTFSPMGSAGAYYPSAPSTSVATQTTLTNDAGTWRLSNNAASGYSRVAATVAVTLTASGGAVPIGTWGSKVDQPGIRTLLVESADLRYAALLEYFAGEGMTAAESQALARQYVDANVLPSGVKQCEAGEVLAAGSACFLTVSYSFSNGAAACDVDIPLVGSPVNLVLRPCSP